MFLNTSEAAAFCRVSTKTLERHRTNGTGPAFTRIGGRIIYKEQSLIDWANANTFKATCEYK